VRIPGVKSAKTFSRWVRARILGGALILGYHRVANVTSDEYEVCITPKHFAEHMEMLNKYTHPIGLAELVQCLKAGSLPPKAVALTFDDGYADNLYEAKPILEKYGIPATIFICTGYLGKEFWWDELERLIMSSQSDLGALRLVVGEKSFEWNQPNISPEVDLDVRSKFHRILYHFLIGLGVEAQNQAMNIIRNWSGRSSSESSSTRSIGPEELLQLANSRLIEIGAHTRYHPMLPRLSLERQREEIVSSKHDLEALLGRQVGGFSYPNGRATGDAKLIVREAGFDYACTSLHDVVKSGHDLHELTRFWQKDVDGNKFLQSLRLWMRGY
jgi:peptidoglycan/xylan/chitin deacetylase (PgdA/CDA1 family)